jgi:hypothetical protein
VDTAGQAEVVFVVAVGRLVLGSADARGVLDLAVSGGVCVGAPIDVLIHASLLVRCLHSGKDFCCEKT